MSTGDGMLKPEVIKLVYQEFLTECYRLAVYFGIQDFNTNTQIQKIFKSGIVRMLKSGIHFERERWILREHTGVLHKDLLKQIQDTYNETF